MANSNPYHARVAKKARTKRRGILTLIDTLWDTMDVAVKVLDRTSDDMDKIKACHCISQIGGQIGRLLEVGELEARLAALEAHLRGKAA
jgi:hypothetical protein